MSPAGEYKEQSREEKKSAGWKRVRGVVITI
jgi:hypothetical protein